MIHRVRMARKRLMVGYSRVQKACWEMFGLGVPTMAAKHRWDREYAALRAIERRKDRIA